MKVFIVAVPLFDSSMEVQAYRLRSRSGEKILGMENDFRTRSVALSATSPALILLKRLGIEPFTNGAPLFVDVNQIMLLADALLNLNIDPAKLICVLPGNIPTDNEVIGKCLQLKQLGYRIGMDGLPDAGTSCPLVPFLDYLVLNYKSPNFSASMNIVKNELPNIQLVLTHVPDNETYEKLATTPNALLTGRFYNQPITKSAAQISPIKINALQLLRQVNEPDFDLDDIAKIIERDPSLSISLMRFINSEAVGLKRKVSSIQNAIAIMGQQEVRRWATVAISISLAEDRPSEVTKLSLVRAKFAENLATAFELGIFQQSLFMAGLFSLLDVILQKPMAEAIEEVAVDKRVQDALVNETGDLYPVLNLIYEYEHARWDDAAIIMIRNNVDIEQVNEAFVEALVWYDQLLKSIDTEVPDGTEDAVPENT